MILCDTHADTLFEMGVKGNRSPLITAASLLAGGLSLQVLALWSGPDGNAGEPELIVQRELNAFETLLQEGLPQVRNPREAMEGKPALMLSIEGCEVFESGLDAVDRYAERGVRMAALVWNHENKFAKPAKSGSREGLSEDGLSVALHMQRLHMAVDVSHLNEQGFLDLFLKTKAPPLASHSCCDALCPHFRNLTDEQIRIMIRNGGYIGVNFYPLFLTGGAADIGDVVNHIDHICQLGGSKHVGFGSDFDGIEVTPDGLASPADFPKLPELLRNRGYRDKDVEAIAGLNLLAYFDRVDAV
ncbi:MAG: membrane dipeptidase [Clostridia bacterium]|nr:membrane dipeptidase [Clostridia bacterium]